MCDLDRDEQGSLSILIGEMQAAEAKLVADYPDIYTRAWINHVGMLESLDELDSVSAKLREWVIAKRDRAEAAAAAAAAAAS